MNMNVSLTEELANFVKAKVGTGRYASSSLLRKAWRDGGDAGELDIAALKQEARARLAESKD
jgi:antitoxin ParD1/3/4